MSYEKQIWVTGEVITANKLNHIEDGIKSVDIPIYDMRGCPFGTLYYAPDSSAEEPSTEMGFIVLTEGEPVYNNYPAIFTNVDGVVGVSNMLSQEWNVYNSVPVTVGIGGWFVTAETRFIKHNIGGDIVLFINENAVEYVAPDEPPLR